MPETLLDRVKRAAPHLFDELGFQVTDLREDPGIISALVGLQGPAFRLRFIVDRGTDLVDIGPLTDPHEWYAIGVVFEFLTGAATQSLAALGPHDFAETGRRIQEHYEGLKDLFDLPDYPKHRREIAEFEQTAPRRFNVPGWKRPGT